MADFTVPGDHVFDELAGKLAGLLISAGWRLATAESCTGGWIAKCCTDLAGSSDWFDRGYVTYSNDAKQELLGVEAGVLATEGAVSEAVALQMADGARRRSGVDIAVAVTGIAGPDGGTAEKPVGTVWFAWSVASHAEAGRIRFSGGREDVRRQSVAHALQGLIDRLVP